MQAVVNPILLYLGCGLGAIGIVLALPRRGVNPQVIGGILAATALGLLFLALGSAAARGASDAAGNTLFSRLPNLNFYLFAAIALGASLRVISHPRPVYAALYFILTILASCGMYVLLSAEFMAFALVIVYAGAILITYLFVIMLATETPAAEAVEALAEYDRYSREPLAATLVGFALLAGLTTLMAGGSAAMSPAVQYAGAARIEQLPQRVENALAGAGLLDEGERLARWPSGEGEASADGFSGRPGEPMIDLSPGGYGVGIAYGDGQVRYVRVDDPAFPKDLAITNTEGVGFALLADHPGGIEVAGVILLMAMLGAVVLARKKVELDERARREHEGRRLVEPEPTDVLEAMERKERGPERGGVTAQAVSGAGVNAGNGLPRGRGTGAGAGLSGSLAGGGGR